MKIHYFTTTGGKNLIFKYLDNLPLEQKVEGYTILKDLEENGLDALDGLDTRQLGSKLWEIKFYRHNRVMYVVVDSENIYIPHACQKQKGKAEKFEIQTAKDRAKKTIDILKK